MSKYKAYPEYKDSGVEWLGEIPTHWICTQIKYGYDITLGKMLQKNKSSSKDELKPYLKAQNIQPTGIDLSVVDNMWFSPDEKNKLLLKNNDVLISEGGDVGRSAIWQGQLAECYIQNAINRARANNGNSPYFLNYWMVYLKSADFINTLCNKATIAHYTAEKVESSPILLPNSVEQLHISLFLDHETAKIDNLIEKQQQLIELLKEKRQAVISHAVTKGLNPDAPMKDSGVEWLGKIPSHWEMKRLAYLGSARNGLTYSPENITDQESGVLVLRSSNIQNSSLCFDDNIYVNSIIPEQFLVKENDLLICSRNGSRNLIGKNALISKDAEGMAFGAFMAIFRSQINTYIFWVLNSPLFDYQSGSFLTSTINQLTIGNLNSMEIPVPTLKEQKEIARYLSKKNDDFIALINKVKNSISLLQERRTALISAAVTGKIDVRDWVAPDTQDIEELQEATA